MNIIALDSADDVLSVSLSTENGCWYIEIDAGKRHSEFLMDCIDNLCKSAGILPQKLDFVACMKGPGSFTGIRIAFSAAKGLALALGIPMITVPTLDCLAYHLSGWPGLTIPAIDAKKNRFFSAIYRNGERLSEYMDASAEDINAEIAKNRLSPDELLVITGSGAVLLSSSLAEYYSLDLIKIDPAFRRGKARELLEISKKCIIINNVSDIDSGPMYLRKSDAEMK